MRPSLPSQRLVPIIVIAVVAVALLAVATGRIGAGSEGKQDVDELISRAFYPQRAKSGRFEASVNASVQAPGGQSGKIEMSMQGVFQTKQEDRVPEFDLDLEVDGPGSPVRVGAVSTGTDVFVQFRGQAYKFPKQQLDRALGGAGKATSGQASLAGLGIDPRSWLKNPTDEGTARVGGVETNHISADVNTDKMISDVLTFAARTDQQDVARNQLEQAKDALGEAHVDLYAAKGDGTLRKLTATVPVSAPQGSGNVDFSVEVSELNKPQTIVAPRNARPFGELESDIASGFVRSFAPGTGAATTPRGTGGSAPRSGKSPSAGSDKSGSAGAGAPATTAPSGPAQAYLECVQAASTKAEISACSPLL